MSDATPMQSPAGREPDYGPGRRCSALTAGGTPCRAWAMRHTMPPLCAVHAKMRQGTAVDAAEPADPAPNTPAPETIEDVFNDLAERQAQLSSYINACIRKGADLQGLMNVFAQHGQNASRLGRLLRDRRALSGEASDGFAGALAQALDELSTELGTAL